MTLQIKDGNTQLQSLSTQSDVAGSLVCVNVPAAVIAGIATPVSAAAPLPVVNAAGAVAVDGSGTIGVGGTAQSLFAGATPANGYMIGNTSAGSLYVSDVGTASATGSSIPIATGSSFATPSGYKPPGPVSIFGATTGQTFAARRW